MSDPSDATLLRLIHHIMEHNPSFARLLCHRGLATLPPQERAAWESRLRPFLDEGEDRRRAG